MLLATAAMLAWTAFQGAGMTGSSDASGWAQEPQPLTLDEVLFRANETVVAYEKAFTRILAEEVYTQRIVGRDADVKRTRTLRSRYLFLHIPGSETWAGLRDTFEVDGAPVENAGTPLAELAGEGLEVLAREASRLTAASEEHYIGEVPRGLNVPTVTLSFLNPLNQHRFAFESTGEEPVDGVPAWRVEYSERQRPSVIRMGRGDIFAYGTFWLEPGLGQVLKSVMNLGDPNMSMRVAMTVTFRRDEGLGLFVPAVLEERYDNPRNPRADQVEGTATYLNYRRLGTAP